MSTVYARSFPFWQGHSMGRFIVSCVLAGAAVILFAVPALACDSEIELPSDNATVGEQLEVTVTVHLTHRSCLVPIEDTQITLAGMDLVSETQWQQLDSLTYQKGIVVMPLTEGQGEIEVVRICPKGGDNTSAVVDIAAGAAPPADLAAEGPAEDEGTAAVQGGGVTGPGLVDDSGPATATGNVPVTLQEPTMREALVSAATRPYIVVLLLLMIAGMVAFVRGYRRVRPFAMLVSVGFLGFFVGGCPCPVGALQNAFLYFDDVTGHMTVFIQLGVVLLAAALVGRIFCGWACPLGAAQYFLFRKDAAGKALVEVSPEYHGILRWSKYGVLVALIVVVVLTGQPVFEDIDPFRLLFNLDFRWGLPLVFLLVLLGTAVIIGFPFCKYVCPLGAFLGLLQPLSLFTLRFTGACTNCKQCYNLACDHGAIQQGRSGPVINERECVRCGECIARCPRGAIVFKPRFVHPRPTVGASAVQPDAVAVVPSRAPVVEYPTGR